MPQTLEEKTKSKFLICPEGHNIAYVRENYARVFTREKDSAGDAVFESGLYCIACNKAYGLSKLKEKK